LHRFTRDDPSNQERQTVLSEITWEPSEDRGAFVQISVRQNHWKYIVTYQGDIGDEAFVSKKVKEELYDLSRDEGELDNLLPGDNAEIEPLRQEALAYLEEVRRVQLGRRGEQIVIDEELKERLRALGYVER